MKIRLQLCVLAWLSYQLAGVWHVTQKSVKSSLDQQTVLIPSYTDAEVTQVTVENGCG